MKPTISVSTITYLTHKYHLTNNFKSLVDLKPDEVYVLDTTADLEQSKIYRKWIEEEAKKYGLPVKIGYKKWDRNYKDANNFALKNCSKDWILQLDSDEMITKEFARDLRDKLASLPPETLVLRPKRLSLLDDDCTTSFGWHPNERPKLRLHGRIFKRGTGKYEGPKNHEQYIYPGRKLKLDDPKHPKKDWHDYYLIHLWLYKDNLMRRRWHPRLIAMLEDKIKGKNVTKENLWKIMKHTFLEKRNLKVYPIPKGVTWVPIEWNFGEQWYLSIYQKYFSKIK